MHMVYVHTYIYIYRCVCVCIHVNMYTGIKYAHGIYTYLSSSSSSYRAGCTDIPDPLSPLLPIVHRPR